MAKHCDDYIDDPAQPECLRRFLDYARLAPSLKYPTGDEAFDRAIEERLGHPMWRDPIPVLFARHEGRPVRVTMASRFGDVGISEDLAGERGYGKRVAVEELTDFSAERPCAWSERVYTNGAITLSIDCAQGSDDPARPKFRPGPGTIAFVDDACGAWGGGFIGNPGNRAASASHNRMLAEISSPEIRRFEGNRAERRAAAARARRA